MTDANQYGKITNDNNMVANINPPNQKKDYVKDNREKIAEELMPDQQNNFKSENKKDHH